MKIQIQNLVPGQEVALANCVATGRVIRRLKKNLYLVQWKNHEMTMRRSQLAVRFRGQWRIGPVNTDQPTTNNTK